ncbi:DUF6641 family protein [Terasakiella sp. SH-1]|uniref:DUF6641 family protein n=1 Tax=Terasakiella sp. SH-1 TaxID=2560057 RepID=UPI001072FF4E|nr:DUF6641 family protein [Terasakiella sp. SH-1]
MELKLSKKRKPLAVVTRRPTPRQVVSNGIIHQLGLLRDPSYKVERYRYVTEQEDGEPVRRKRPVKSAPRKWFFEVDGKWYVEVRYGSSYVLEIEPGCPSVECGDSQEDVITVLEHLLDMVENGDLDDQIAVLKEKAKRREKA